MWWILMLLGLDRDTRHWEMAYPTDAVASSYLKSGYNLHDENYHPRYVLDGDPATAWNEGAPGAGAGEWLALHFLDMGAVSSVRLSLRNGYQKSPDLQAANATPKDVRITLRTADGQVHHTGLHTLTAEEGWQTLTITPPQPIPMQALRIELLSVYPGQTYADACISDITVEVVASGLDEDAQLAEHSAMMAWMAERAAEGQAQRTVDPMVSRTFRHVEQDPATVSPDTLATLSAQLDRLLAGGARVRGEAIIDRPPVQHASQYSVKPSTDWMGIDYLVSLEGVHFSETDAAWRAELRQSSLIVNGEADSGPLLYTRSNLRVSRQGERVHQVAGQVRFPNWPRLLSGGRWSSEQMDRRYLITYDSRQRAQQILLVDESPDRSARQTLIELEWRSGRVVQYHINGHRYEPA